MIWRGWLANLKERQIVEKINDYIIATFTAVFSLLAFLAKKLYSRIDRMESRIDDMENKLLTREDVKAITDTQNLILQHLLEHRTKEGVDVHK